jgi:hypothetical protein
MIDEPEVMPEPQIDYVLPEPIIDPMPEPVIEKPEENFEYNPIDEIVGDYVIDGYEGNKND